MFPLEEADVSRVARRVVLNPTSCISSSRPTEIISPLRVTFDSPENSGVTLRGTPINGLEAECVRAEEKSVCVRVVECRTRGPIDKRVGQFDTANNWKCWTLDNSTWLLSRAAKIISWPIDPAARVLCRRLVYVGPKENVKDGRGAPRDLAR